ncbi:MAG: aspartate/glutamate racemase family protein [Acidimicrobiia bacterium]
MDGRGLIGIVSGLGPLAGSDVLDKALAYAAVRYGAVEDADYPDIVLFSHGIDDFDSTGSIEDDFVRELVGVVQEIELHHPTVVGVACNTAHLHLDELRAHTSAQFVNLIEETAEAASQFDRNYLLLSSSTTRQTHLYHDALKRRGVRFSDVCADDQLKVDNVVHAVMAHELDRAGSEIEALVRRLATAGRFDGIIPACTELPIAFDHSDISTTTPIIDSNRVLAGALVDSYFRITRTGRMLVRAD